MYAKRRFAGSSKHGWLWHLALLWSVLTAGQGAGAQVGSSALLQPAAIAYDAQGNLYIADTERNQVFEATLAGALVTVAGTGVQGFAGDGGPATAAQLNQPQGLAFGPDGTLYIADTGSARIRAVNAGVISTFAGTGARTFGGDGGPPAKATFRWPTALAVDASGTLLVCDSADHRVRRLGPAVSTVAGNGVQGFAGDGAAATLAELDTPSGLAVATDGRLFLADTHNGRVRVVSTMGTIATFAGTGQRGFSGDGGQATAAPLSAPRGLAVTTDGALLIADADNERVRRVDASGVISTLAGTGVEGTSVDGTLGAKASLHAPRPVALSSFGLPVVGDALNGTVRVLTAAGTLYQPAALASGRVSAVQASAASAQTYGQVEATVSVSGPVKAPEGVVTLSENGSSLTTVTLVAATGNVSLPRLDAGTHTLGLAFGGDGLNPAATGSLGPFTVAPAVVTVVASSATSVYGAPLPTLSGSINGLLATDAGQVQVVFSASGAGILAVGNYPITASLTGVKSSDYIVKTGGSAGTLTITQAGSQTTLASVAQGFVGMPLQLTASVAPGTSGSPGGTVQFLDEGTVVAFASVVNGSASAVYASPPAGSRSLTAQYSGDHNFEPSSSAAEIAVVGAMPDFTLALAGASAKTVSAGSVASYSMLVGAQPGPFTGVVTFSASGLPPGATVTFSPVQVVPGVSVATVTATVQTEALQVAARRTSNRKQGAFVALGTCLFLGSWWGRRRRRWLFVLGAAMALCGCGARTVGEGVGGEVSTAYTVQITGTSTNLLGAVVTHTAGATLTIQN